MGVCFVLKDFQVATYTDTNRKKINRLDWVLDVYLSTVVRTKRPERGIHLPSTFFEKKSTLKMIKNVFCPTVEHEQNGPVGCLCSLLVRSEVCIARFQAFLGPYNRMYLL